MRAYNFIAKTNGKTKLPEPQATITKGKTLKIISKFAYFMNASNALHHFIQDYNQHCLKILLSSSNSDLY